MKVFAYYLPQFHRVPENDEWWGEGFTDWVAARNGRPLFQDHYQPRIPLNENYYDLMKKDTMRWQAELMKKYGIDGVCIYHYWFKCGKQILEKPAQNLLTWKDIDMPFCFYWANATWAKSWSNIRGANKWADIYEKEGKNEGNSILLEQTYGTEQDWEKHFRYLLPFFKDSRYIKIDGKPLFMIYRSFDIPCLQEMLAYWKKRAVIEGLKGIYVIGAQANTRVTAEVDAFLLHEPGNSMDKLLQDNLSEGVQCLEYANVWEEILKNMDEGRKTYYCGFSGYDDTPRRGHKGKVILHSDPEQFQKYLMELLAKSESEKKEIVFLNGWNEWGEGMYLEPDQRYGTKYLESVKKAKEEYKKQESIELDSSTLYLKQEIKKIRRRSDKFETYLNLLDDWMCIREKNVRLDGYFADKGYKKIAIYGYGIFGRHLETEFLDSRMELVCIIDRRSSNIAARVPVYLPGEVLPEFDVLIVASYYFYNEIEKEMCSDSYDIISIETVIKDVFLSSQ